MEAVRREETVQALERGVHRTKGEPFHRTTVMTAVVQKVARAQGVYPEPVDQTRAERIQEESQRQVVEQGPVAPAAREDAGSLRMEVGLLEPVGKQQAPPWVQEQDMAGALLAWPV